jgi:hypothetical protein
MKSGRPTDDFPDEQTVVENRPREISRKVGDRNDLTPLSVPCRLWEERCFPSRRPTERLRGILEQAVGEAFRGREVFVEEVDPSWNLTDSGFYSVAADGKGAKRAS